MPVKRMTLGLVLALAVNTSVSAADTLRGRTHVVDGDTIRVADIPVRLKGIAAPELREPSGQEAKAYLAKLAEGRVVVCELTGERTHGRRVGTCRLDGHDLAQQVIAAGLARLSEVQRRAIPDG